MDRGQYLRWNILLLTVVATSQFSPPGIPPGVPIYISLSENTTIGTKIFTLRAVDADSDVLYFRASTQDGTASLVRLGPTVFNSSLNQWTCDMFLNSELDRDSPSASSRALSFYLTDNYTEVLVRMSMFISDVNDNPPKFVGTPYRTSIKEDLKTGSFVFRVSATDPDSQLGAVVVFSMKSVIGEDNQEFLLEMYDGNITLQKPLDYERQSFYHYNVSAKDQGDPPCPGDTCQCKGPAETCNPAPVDLFITIIDVQDTPPIFERLPYIGRVAENETVGFPILQVTALDGDRGVGQPNKVIFSFTGGDFSPFTINETDGTIHVGINLDADEDDVRDKAGLYVFTVTATEVSTQDSNPNNQSSTQVSITVTDVNDNPPRFTANNFTAVVLENTPAGVPITTISPIEVFDKDQGSNSRFWIYLEKDGFPYLDFDTLPKQNSEIQGRSTINIRVLNSSVLDYETTKTISFKIIARESNTDPKISSSSEATVTLEIEDTNDNNPYFPSQATAFDVSEDASIGHVIANITADDDDSGDFGRIIFSLEPDGHDGEFNITDWGQIQVAKPLDREGRSFYFLAVVATDSPSASPNQRRRSTLRIGVNITDVNDHAPVWTQYIPYISILESLAVGNKVADVRAIDLDTGINAQIEYFISPGTNGSQLFNISTTKGAAEVNVRQSLIDYSGLRFVQIVAVDKGKPPLSASVGLSIFVIDENQNRPVFVHPDQAELNKQNESIAEIMVEEERPVGSILYTFLATDKDMGENGRVEYYLNPSTNKDYEYFTVARISGTLHAALRLDREAKPIYEIQVRAEDNGRPASLSATVTMRIKLTDINDNLPSYRDVKMPQVLHVIEEDSDAFVGQIQPAIDADSYPNNQSCYYLFGHTSAGLSLNKYNGSLYVTEKVDRETTSALNVIIKASENCSLANDYYISANNTSATSPRNSVNKAPSTYDSSDDSLLWLQVIVDDINDNAPTFLYHDISASAIFDVDVGTEVLSLATSVADKDTSANSKNMFRLVSITQELENGVSPETAKAFLVSVNGSITTNIRFQSDLLGYYLLSVMVYDDDGMSDAANVKIYLISNLQRVKLVFNKDVNQVEQLKNSFLKKLSDILNLDILMDKIQSHARPDGTRDPARTDAYIHGRYRDTGKVVPASDLWQMLDLNHEARAFLYSNGVAEAKPLTEENIDNETAELKRIFAILISVLAIIVIALILVLIHLVRLYRRRLKAATLAYSPTKEKEIFDPPGTNKFFTAKNPLFGKDIKHAAMDEDKTSHNSLDINEVHQPYSTIEPPKYQDQSEEQEVVMQIQDSNEVATNRSSHLDQVLHAYRNDAYDNNDDVVYENDVDYDLYERNQRIHFVGEDFQEGVTRFSDEIKSRDSGLSDPNIKRHLEHTDI